MIPLKKLSAKRRARKNSVADSGQQKADSSDSGIGVLVVGSVGSGKSSTIAKCTGSASVKTGDGHRSVTRTCQVHPVCQSIKNTLCLPQSASGVRFVDTVGWEDADGDDVDTFQQMLVSLNRHGLTRLRAVVWTLHPGMIRKTEAISRMAAFIDQFAPDEGKIWSNVIIICKQSLNPEHDSAGALRTIAELSPLSKPQVLGYRFLDDSTLTESQKAHYESDSESRKIFKVLDDRQVAETVWEAIGRIDNDVQIIFNDSKCDDCGAMGDRRLLPQFCHMEKELRHSGKLRLRHPATDELYHPLNGSEWTHTSSDIIEPKARLAFLRPWIKRLFCCCCVPPGRRYRVHACCMNEAGSRGCVETWKCCGARRYNDRGRGEDGATAAALTNPASIGCRRRWRCCRVDVEENSTTQGCRQFYSCCEGAPASDGCSAVCKKCGAEWGTETRDCFKKSHNLLY